MCDARVVVTCVSQNEAQAVDRRRWLLQSGHCTQAVLVVDQIMWTNLVTRYALWCKQLCKPRARPRAPTLGAWSRCLYREFAQDNVSAR